MLQSHGTTYLVEFVSTSTVTNWYCTSKGNMEEQLQIVGKVPVLRVRGGLWLVQAQILGTNTSTTGTRNTCTSTTSFVLS